MVRTLPDTWCQVGTDGDEADPLRFFGTRVCRGSWQLFYRRLYVGSVAAGDEAKASTLLRTAQQNFKKKCVNQGMERFPQQTRPHLARLFHAADGVMEDTAPGDITAAIEAAKSHKDMFASEPGLHLASIQGKYQPWKEKLHQAWMEEVAGQPQQWGPGVLGSKLTECQRGRRLYAVLVRAARSLDSVDYQVWVTHCGRNVSHHSGFLAMLQALDLLTMEPEGSPGVLGSDILRLSQKQVGSRSLYRVQPYTVKVGRTLQGYLKAADQLAAALEEPPRTCAAWLQKYEALCVELRKLKARNLSPDTGKYIVPWTFRAAAISQMRAANPPICQLSGDADFTAQNLHDAFPDSNSWLTESHFGAGCWSARELRTRLQYSRETEYLAMRTCLYLDPELQLHNPAWLLKHQAGLRAARARMQACIGFTPHLAVLLRAVREDQFDGHSDPIYLTPSPLPASWRREVPAESRPAPAGEEPAKRRRLNRKAPAVPALASKPASPKEEDFDDCTLAEALQSMLGSPASPVPVDWF